MSSHHPIMTRDELAAFLDREFPQMHAGGRSYFVDGIGPLSARMRMEYHESHLRPGGTISGPAMTAEGVEGRGLDRLARPHPEEPLQAASRRRSSVLSGHSFETQPHGCSLG
jgi:hypothetical protein